MRQRSIRNVAIVIPTCNAGRDFESLLTEIAAQSQKIAYKLLIDSSSTDGTVGLAEKYGWHTVVILRDDFSHGGTRQKALEMLPLDIGIVIYITQDIRLPQKDSLAILVKAFENQCIGAAYGRQVPHRNASIYAAVDREFNYPAVSRIKGIEDSCELGIKTAFLSDSYAAYRVAYLREIGGFPHIDICEDMYVTGKLLLAGRKIAYVAEAEAEHSHEPCIKNMWQRYRLMGKFQRKNSWLGENFGSAGNEGLKLLKYQIKFCIANRKLFSLFKMFVLNVIKYISFKC